MKKGPSGYGRRWQERVLRRRWRSPASRPSGRAQDACEAAHERTTLPSPWCNPYKFAAGILSGARERPRLPSSDLASSPQRPDVGVELAFAGVEAVRSINARVACQHVVAGGKDPTERAVLPDRREGVRLINERPAGDAEPAVPSAPLPRSMRVT